MKRFTRWLPVLILIPLWGGGLVLDRIAERALLDSVHDRLVTALHAHQRHVLTMLAHQQQSLRLFAVGVTASLAGAPTGRKVPVLHGPSLASLMPEAIGCVLLDAERRPISRIGADWPPSEEIATEFPPGTTESRVTDPLQEPTGPSVYDVYVPLKAVSGGQPSTLSNPQSAVVGTLACRLKNTLSKALAEHRAGLGLSGEVYLVNAKTHLMLTESRFIPNAIGRVKVDTIGMREALKMRNGIAPYPDYRGIPVVGTFLYLRDYDWVLLAEMDEAEALAPLLRLRMAVGLSLVLISVVTGAVGWRYGRQLSEAYAQTEKARDVAKEAEAQVKALLRSMADAVFEIDESSTILIANESAHRMFGWPSGELVGQKVTTLMPPEDVIKHETGLRRYLETGESRIIGKCIEVTGLRRDGSPFPCELSIAVVLLPDGSRRFVGVHRDITARLQLESRNRRLAQAIHTAMDGIALADPQSVIIETNPAFNRMFGYEPGELIGRHASCLYPPAWFEKEFAAIAAATRETGWAGEVLGLRKDGSTFPRWISTSPIHDPEGRLIAMLSVSRDITERKRAEEAIHASEVRYRRLFESAKDGILVLDFKTGMVIDVNPFLTALLGFSREIFLGKKIWELGPFKDIVANQDNFLELQQKEYIRYEDMPLETADGRHIQVEFVSNAYLVDHTKVIQCNIRDITERKQAEEALKQRLEELERFQKATVQREFRIKELKDEIERLKGKQ